MGKDPVQKRTEFNQNVPHPALIPYLAGLWEKRS